ncbi:Hsp20/alpha crystallin family protein [Desulfitobacterium metallireducens]|uniref:Heat-shock protein Hsp20 n=1 Tax=Desulfitobacterium metallireducens DSM 15288 TaxID=871968 RepID=W0EEN5_9FIRM|nr:Hsp20/alpha crystallin family protein [Desulfitobacterium metallireducens]AHF07546.1 heat-shock protein Hsp20 [Desulfitobacterium metallireducens DSM 15288]
MALVPYEPFRMFEPIWEEMDRHFHPGRGEEALSKWLYRVDVEETVENVIVTAEIPGIENKEDLHLEIDENKLTIHGEIKRNTTETERFSHHSERFFGRFNRTITLPAVVKADGAHAAYKNGVLELTLLKDRHPAARSIEVDFH